MASGQNKYATLISNTVIFALGTFGSKLLVFLLMPLYTSYLTTAEYGAMDVVVNVSNMLLPLVIVSINDGVIRFGMDRAYHRQDVFSTGIWVSLAGFGVFLLFCPLLARIEMNARLEKEIVATFAQRQAELRSLDEKLEQRAQDLRRLLDQAEGITRSPQFLRELILNGQRKGLSAKQIARNAGLSVDEVELIMSQNS